MTIIFLAKQLSHSVYFDHVYQTSNLRTFRLNSVCAPYVNKKKRFGYFCEILLRLNLNFTQAYPSGRLLTEISSETLAYCSERMLVSDSAYK